MSDYPVEKLLGNRMEAAKKLPWARNRLKALKKYVNAGEWLKNTWKLDGGQTTVQIIKRPVGADEIRVTSSVQSGPLWSGIAFPAYDENYPINPAPTFWTGKTAGGKVWHFASFCPSGITVANAPDAYKPERTLEISVLGKVPYASTGIGDPPYTCLPGLYSGRMRRVVQHMLGAGQVPPWSSRWDNCAWLFTASDDSEWVINVERNTGVRAAPLTYLDSPSRACPGMPWRIAKGHGDWVTLLSAEDMTPYFDTREISLDIGFAANDHGTEARNLSQRMGVISPDPTGVTHVYEWLIQITEDQDEEGNFYPSAATLTLVYDYTAWESLGGRIHMPLGPFYSQPWDVQLPYGPEYPVSKPVDSNSFSWPVHVYYDGDTVKRVMALYNHNIPPEERIPPDPKGATDADVWKADGFDTYPFVGSFPKSGTGTFSLGSTKTYYPKLTFEGDGMPEDAGNGYNYSDGGTDTFTLEQFGDADGRLVAMGYNGKAVICGGGPIFKAVRTRTQLNTGEAQSHYQAVWIPWGDRDAILSCEYHVHIGSTYTATRSVRHSHMFCSGIEVVPGNPGDGRPCCPQQNDGYIIQKIGGISAVFNGLPAPVDAANTYATNWKQPTAICPVPDGSYPSSYLCTESDFLGLLPNASSYDEFLGTTQEAETTFSYAVRLARSGAGVEELDAGDTQLPMVDWLLGIRNEQDFYNPLRMLRTYSGQGVAMAFPSTLYIKPIGGIYSIYLDFIKDHGMLSLWVGEPH